MREPAPGRPAVVVVTWQGAHLLGPCLDSLRRQTLPHDVLVVDNASTDGTRELLAERFPEVRVLVSPRNTGFAGGVALALDATSAEFVALLNNDAVAEPDWLAALVEELTGRPEAAAVTSRLMLAGTEPPRVNNAGVLLLPDRYGADRGLGDPPEKWSMPDEVFGFSGGAALLRRSALDDVGGFPAPFFLYYEDTDTSWRLRLAGWTIRYQPRAVVQHRHAASSDVRSRAFAFYNERNRLLMLLRCAPGPECARWWLRYLVTTGSVGLRRALRRPVPADHRFRLGLRLHAFAAALRLLPWALVARRRFSRRRRGGSAAGPPAAVVPRPVR